MKSSLPVPDSLHLDERGGGAEVGPATRPFPVSTSSSANTPMEIAMTRLLGTMTDSRFDITTSLKVNISGRNFEIENSKLMMHPNSLLASPDREAYFDTDLDCYFFDRNRQVFEAVMEVYQNYGQIRYPSYFQEELVVEELKFFRLDDGISYFETDESDDEEVSDGPDENSIKHRIDTFLNEPASSLPAKIWMIIDLTLIVLSLLHFVIDTRLDHDDSLDSTSWHDVLEMFCEGANVVGVGFFTVDLFLRFIVCHSKKRFVKQLTNWFDLLAIFPFYLGGFMEYLKIDPLKFKIFQLFRIARVARVLKVIKRSKRLLVIGMILYECLNELCMLFVFWSMGVFFYGSLMYYAEHSEDETKFTSILQACWWSVVTMSSVGYGDIYPTSPFGKVLGSCIIFSSTVFMAVPMTIINTKFKECYDKIKSSGYKPFKQKRR